MKKFSALFFLLVLTKLDASVVTTNNLGEYFDLQNNSVERLIYCQLNLTATDVTLFVFSPQITTEIPPGLANIVVTPKVINKSLASLVNDKKIGADVEITFQTNSQSLTPGYLASLSVLGQVLNTNIYSNPNPLQYFMLQMYPLAGLTAGLSQVVFSDLYYKGITTKKWLLPPENNFPSLGVFISETWKNPLILESLTNAPSKITFYFEIPLSSFANLTLGVYQVRIAAVMLPTQQMPSFAADQIGSLTKLLDSAVATTTSPNSIYVPNAAQLANINANALYLTKLIQEIRSFKTGS
jgi:hypothetical protein